MIPLGQIPAERLADHSSVLIVAFDPARHDISGGRFLVIESDGRFSWVKMEHLVSGWKYDVEAGVWVSDVVDSAFAEQMAEIEQEEFGSETPAAMQQP